ncbi:MAG TPA: thioredoxin domain-containing protein [Candidatus Paceibacterota bacterium]
MNTKRILSWVIFIVVLGLIIWGVIASMNKDLSTPKVGTPAAVSATTDHIRTYGPTGTQGTSTVAAAPIELLEYSDFQCPACEAYYPVVSQVLASSTVPIKFIYRHFPLPQHQNAKPAAYASEAASMQGKFWEMYDLLFKNHAEWTELADPTPVFEGYAQRIGLNVTKFKSDSASQTVHDLIDTAITSDQKLGLFQTPTFFVNGKMIPNPQSYAEFNSVLQKAAR